MPSNRDTHRRSFLGHLTALGAGIIAASATPVEGFAQRPNRQARSPHDSWMEKVPGKHRQVFHAVAASDTPMLMAQNYLDAYREAFDARPGEARAVIGMHGPALIAGLGDDLWERYGLGAQHAVTDPNTKEPARRNIFRTGTPLSIDTLQRAGVLFLLCNTALRLRTKALAQSTGRTAEEVYAEFRQSVLPDIVVVPALVVALNRAQERGFTYVRAS